VFSISWICLDPTDKGLEDGPLAVPMLAEGDARKEGVRKGGQERAVRWERTGRVSLSWGTAKHGNTVG